MNWRRSALKRVLPNVYTNESFPANSSTRPQIRTRYEHARFNNNNNNGRKRREIISSRPTDLNGGVTSEPVGDDERWKQFPHERLFYTYGWLGVAARSDTRSFISTYARRRFEKKTIVERNFLWLSSPTNRFDFGRLPYNSFVNGIRTLLYVVFGRILNRKDGRRKSIRYRQFSRGGERG